MTESRAKNRTAGNESTGSTFGRYLCREGRAPGMWERIDLPQVADLKQETVLRVLEVVSSDEDRAGRCGCEELIDQNANLAHRAWFVARADFFRQRNGRSKRAIAPVSTPPTAEVAAASRPEPLHVDLGYVLHRAVEEGAMRLGGDVIERVIAAMAEAQQHRRSGERLRGLPGSLRQKIGRLRRETGLPLDVRLL